MSENENTINPATEPKLEFADTVNLNKIGGEKIFITDITVNRGKPNDYTQATEIGEDGLTEYRTITTEETFNLDFKGEQKQINHFYVPVAVKNQLIKYVDDLKDGKRYGPVKAKKRPKKDNPNQFYWCLVNENDSDY